MPTVSNPHFRHPDSGWEAIARAGLLEVEESPLGALPGAEEWAPKERPEAALVVNRAVPSAAIVAAEASAVQRAVETAAVDSAVAMEHSVALAAGSRSVVAMAWLKARFAAAVVSRAVPSAEVAAAEATAAAAGSAATEHFVASEAALRSAAGWVFGKVSLKARFEAAVDPAVPSAAVAVAAGSVLVPRCIVRLKEAWSRSVVGRRASRSETVGLLLVTHCIVPSKEASSRLAVVSAAGKA